MKHSIPLSLIIFGSLLVAMPFLYAYLVKVSVESLTDEAITYIVMLTGMLSLYRGAQAMNHD